MIRIEEGGYRKFLNCSDVFVLSLSLSLLLSLSLPPSLPPSLGHGSLSRSVVVMELLILIRVALRVWPPLEWITLVLV